MYDKHAFPKTNNDEAHNSQRENGTKAVSDYQYDHQLTPDAHNHEKQQFERWYADLD
jgi:hypothetical protein